MYRFLVGITLSLLPTVVLAAATPEPLLLWPDGAPGALGTQPKDRPAVFVYPASADKANGAAVVVCPGGGLVGWP